MPQILVFAVVAGAALLVWRTVGREMKRVGEELRREEARNQTAAVPLERGADGIYRPADEAARQDRD